MPSREEIVEWLKKEGDNTVLFWVNIIGTKRAKEKASIWYNRAAQVENMRCENCNKVSDCVAYLVIGQDAKDFGCFSYEPKEANHE